jgi:methylglutaconyl-CoA hydratase
MGYQTLTYQTDDEIAIIALTVPEKRNAISTQMVTDVAGAFQQAEEGPAHAVILTGSGKAFCSGMDMDELRGSVDRPLQKNLEDVRRLSKMFYRIYSFPKPVISAVNGPAIAGGCLLATLADFTLAVPEAKFGYPEVKLAILPAFVAVFLRRQVGQRHARELLFSGRILDATEASRLGLVTEIVISERLMDRAREIARSLLAASPNAIARTKKFLLGFDDTGVRAELEAAIEASADMRSDEDFREGVSAFLEKRAPQWKGH